MRGKLPPRRKPKERAGYLEALSRPVFQAAGSPTPSPTSSGSSGSWATAAPITSSGSRGARFLLRHPAGHTMSEHSKALVRKIYQATETGDAAILDTVVTDDVIEHPLNPGQPPGREALKQIFGSFSVLVPDLRITVEDIIAGGDRAAVRSTCHRHTGRPLPRRRPGRAADAVRGHRHLARSRRPGRRGLARGGLRRRTCGLGRGHLRVPATRHRAAAGSRRRGRRARRSAGSRAPLV